MNKIDPLASIWEALQDTWDAALELILINLLWVFFAALVVTLPGAMAGLFYSTHRLAYRESIGWRSFFEGFRRFFTVGLRWTLVNLVVLALFFVNFWFYGRVEPAWSEWVRGIFLGLSLLWIALQLFTFPLLLEQEDRGMLTALRNSLVLYLSFPKYSLLVLALVFVLAVVSTLLQVPWFLLTVSLSAFLVSRAVAQMLRAMQAGQAGS